MREGAARESGLDIMAAALAAAARTVAAHINGGATIWCVAPGLDDHARHLAVEFVHPASLGARAVPAVALPTLPPVALVASVRSAVRSGDVLITLGEGDASVIEELGMRAPAWGVAHVHLGWMSAAQFGSKTTLTVPLPKDARTDRFITRAYHLLWELVFLCPPTPTRSDAELTSACAVCADEAALAEVEIAIDDDRAMVRTACGPVVVDVSLVGPVTRNDLLLIHAGTALRSLSPLGTA